MQVIFSRRLFALSVDLCSATTNLCFSVIDILLQPLDTQLSFALGGNTKIYCTDGRLPRLVDVFRNGYITEY